MTNRWNNLAMWAHYAAEHTGYCLEFRREGLFTAAREVTYDATVSLNVNDPNAARRYWFYYKHPDWRFEEEVRIVFPTESTPGPSIQFAPTSLARIILGGKSDKTLVKEVLAVASSRTPPLRVEVAEYDAFSQELRTHPA
jgi:hypothetical protein